MRVTLPPGRYILLNIGLICQAGVRINCFQKCEHKLVSNFALQDGGEALRVAAQEDLCALSPRFVGAFQVSLQKDNDHGRL